MKLHECEVNDIIRFKEGGSLWMIIIKGLARFSFNRQRVTVQNMNGITRTYEDRDPMYMQDVINLTKLFVVSQAVSCAVFAAEARR